MSSRRSSIGHRLAESVAGHRAWLRRQILHCILPIGLLFLPTGCATPIGVVRGTTQDIHYALTSNVLSAGAPSSWSLQVLHRTNLSEHFAADPEKTLGDLRKLLTQPVGEELLRDRLFALAELSFHQAEQSGKSEHYLAAAIYAYAFLFPDDAKQAIDPLDPRSRWAADLYNRGLTRFELPYAECVTFFALTETRVSNTLWSRL